METEVDAVVVGGGVVGSCAAYSLAKAGKRTLLLDQFAVPHALGSSGGKSRITRLANFGTEYLTPIMADAYMQWVKISDLVQEELMSPSPLVIASQQSDLIDYIASTIETCGHTPKRLTPREINAKHKTRIPEDLYMIEDPTCATLRADRCVLAVQKLYRSLGGVVLDRWPVTTVKPGRPWIKISGPRGSVRARSLVLCPGPWAQQLLKPLGIQLPLRFVRTKTYKWRTKEIPFPAYVHMVTRKDYYFALPSLEHPDSKKVGFNKMPEGTPAGGEPEQSFQREAIVKYFTEHFSMDGDAPDSEELCWYTMTPDKEFILDRHPQHDNIVYAVGFSGTGFKIAPTLGNILAAMVQRRDPGFPVSFFRAARFKKTDGGGPTLKSKF
ncbi:peroxisomal sarcosine oxidase-like [Panulirus ornatus]|uniref:peroxisomal sarcosine oxidase-like n=1 Tax=Panulirus ornatus TaxID=150431 RepID=UPI003A8BC835